MELEAYLFFDGNCEEALNYYKGVFGGEVTTLNRYEGSPMEAQVPPDYKNKIIHAVFQAPTLKFMASDGRPGTQRGEGRVSLSLATRDNAEAERVFNALADGGTIDMPLANSFWGAKFGMCTDRFGLDWMVSCFE